MSKLHWTNDWRRRPEGNVMKLRWRPWKADGEETGPESDTAGKPRASHSENEDNQDTPHFCQNVLYEWLLLGRPWNHTSFYPLYVSCLLRRKIFSLKCIAISLLTDYEKPGYVCKLKRRISLTNMTKIQSSYPILCFSITGLPMFRGRL